MQGFELDDYCSEAPLHSNAVVFPALFAADEHIIDRAGSNPVVVNGASFLLATIVDYEVGPRVVLGLYGGNKLSRGWHSGAVFGSSASAASASKLLNLPANEIDALGEAYTQACGLMSAQSESMVKRMQHGYAARNILLAAMLARGKHTGMQRVYERPYGGFLSTFGQGFGKDLE